MGFVRLLGVMAMGGGRCGGLSVAGRLHGSSRSKSSDMGSSGDLSSRVYFEGGSAEKPKNDHVTRLNA